MSPETTSTTILPFHGPGWDTLRDAEIEVLSDENPEISIFSFVWSSLDYNLYALCSLPGFLILSFPVRSNEADGNQLNALNKIEMTEPSASQNSTTILHGGGDSSFFEGLSDRTSEVGGSCPGRRGRRYSFVQGQIFMPTLISVSVPPLCYRRNSTLKIPVILPKVHVAGYS